MLRRCFKLWVVLTVVGPAWGQTNQVFSPAKEICDVGMQHLHESTQSLDPGAAMGSLQLAIENFQTALELDRNYCPAHHGWALALVTFSNRTTDRDQFLKAIAEARARFAYAAGCAGVDPQVFDDWGSLLLARVDILAQSAYARYSILTEAREALTKGLKRARNPEELAKFNGLVGQCLVRLVLYSPDPKERAAMFGEANTRFEAATQHGKAGQFAGVYATWGLALLKLGQNSGDSNVLWQAIDRMQVGLKKVPNDKDSAALVLHYNMACTYSALGDFSNALLHLRACIENDPGGGYVNTARGDTDLAALQRTEEFQTLIRSHLTKAGPSPQDTPENRARFLCREGNDLASRAVTATNDVARARYFDQAIEKYRATTELLPDFIPAHMMWANCLAQTEAFATNRTTRLERIQRTRDRFAAAAKCAKADARLYEAWGNYVASRADTIGEKPADKIAVLEEAKVIYEKGLAAARFSGETAELQMQIGMCLVSMGGYETDRVKKRIRYEDATAALGEAATVDTYAKSPRVNGMWGVALTKIGQLTADPLKLREATRRFKLALDVEPDNPEINYNVACAYALLHDPDEAIRYLRTCFDKDPTGTYYKSVEADPDFKPIRTSASYKDIFRPQLRFDSLTKPTLSN